MRLIRTLCTAGARIRIYLACCRRKTDLHSFQRIQPTGAATLRSLIGSDVIAFIEPRFRS